MLLWLLNAVHQAYTSTACVDESGASVHSCTWWHCLDSLVVCLSLLHLSCVFCFRLVGLSLCSLACNAGSPHAQPEVLPQHILCITFTNKAAEELQTHSSSSSQLMRMAWATAVCWPARFTAGATGC
jgi:hypothetical protein